MNRFIRVISTILIFFLVLIAVLTIVYWVRQSNAEKLYVHRDSQSIIKINADKIFVQIAKNAIANPSTYFYPSQSDTTSQDDEVDINWWNLGVHIPAHLYFFTLPQDDLTYYAIQEVADFEKLKKTFTALGVSFVQEEDSLWYATPKKQIAILSDGHVLVVALSSGAPIRDELKKLLIHMDNLVAAKEWSGNLESDAEISYRNRVNQNFWDLTFSAGLIDLSGDFYHDLWVLSDTPQHLNLDSNQTLLFSFHADIRPILKQNEKFFKSLQLDMDSVLPYVGDYMALQWRNESVMQRDSIISYDYDDNFEMVEKIGIREEAVPHLSFFLKSSPHLLAYLPDKLFYQFHKSSLSEVVRLSTSEDKVSADFVSKPYHMYLRYLNDGDNLLIGHFPKFSLIQNINIKGNKIFDQGLNVHCRVRFSQSNLHPVVQFFSFYKL